MLELKHYPRITSLLVSLAALCLPAPAQGRQAGTWVKVEPARAQFSVLMPGKPEEETEQIRLMGNDYERRAFTATDEDDGSVYIVLTQALPSVVTAASHREIIEGFVGGVGTEFAKAFGKEGVETRLDFTRDLTLGGHEGRQYSLSIGETRGVLRVYLVNKRRVFLQLILGGRDSDPAAARFLDSLKILIAREHVAATGAALGGRKTDGPSGPIGPVGPVGPPASAPPKVSLGGPSGVRAPISGGVLNGKALSKPAPPYPAVAKAARAQGVVVVQITVDEEGKVISASAVSGHPLLRQAAVQAANQALFSPTLLSGQPVKVTGTITYNFVLLLKTEADYDDAGRIRRLRNLAEKSGPCVPTHVTGSISSVQLADDGKTLAALVVKTEDGRLVTVTLGGKLYRDLSADAQDKLTELLAAGRGVSILAYGCDAAGEQLLAEDIEAQAPAR